METEMIVKLIDFQMISSRKPTFKSVNDFSIFQNCYDTV